MAFPARSWSPLLVALLLAVGGCRCGDPGTGGTRQGFRPQQDVVDFGRVLEGEPARREVTLLATGRSSVTVTASTGAPFSVTASEVNVPGSGTATVEVVFTAGNGAAEGTLQLAGAGETATVRLTGVGVRPKPCPAPPCRESRFDLESGECVETPAEEGAACIPESRCQENGRCESGACVGRPRSCNDDNPCTVDSCSPTSGCVTSQVACPEPTNPCKVGVCEREEGCTEVDAQDLTPCGPLDCKTGNVCLRGSCIELPTPDGTVCAPATACVAASTCQGGECERPDAGDLAPTFEQELGGAPVSESGGPVLLVQDGALFTSVCGGDAGCRLVSYTAQGLLRFESPYPDGGVRTLLATSQAGVVVLASEGLEGYAPRNPGARLWESPWEAMGAPDDAGTWEGATGVGRVALTDTGDVLAYVDWRSAPDGGVDAGDGGELPLPAPEAARLVWLAGSTDADAGTTAGTLLRAAPAEAWPGEARLALDVSGEAFLYSTNGRLARTRPEEDGGTVLRFTEVTDGGVPDGGASLAVAGGTLLVGARAFVPTDAGTADGGAVVEVDWDAGTRRLTPLVEPALLSAAGSPGYLFAYSCARTDGVKCTPAEDRVVLRAVDARTGRLEWEVDALPDPRLPGTLHEATLVQGDAVGVLAEAQLPDGPQVWMQLFARGERVGMCPLPGRPRLAGAAFVGSRLHVVVEREGVWMLESYQVDGVAQARGWPQRHGGAGGRRSEAPQPQPQPQ
ncbi:hypothetical protein [Pyxidicoccus xibeiensis]|uniref:hypothetical protein n=1 Tax=Pyxidicoccus xibeiensis TaxID=2906759 RepID=UPI0020A749F9|nr:hypothetical protein [Pyxidicoccus xibeiensis]MCP3141808.1 hypothetical protein [Pyxidicoccus xibeiensis]